MKVLYTVYEIRGKASCAMHRSSQRNQLPPRYEYAFHPRIRRSLNIFLKSKISFVCKFALVYYTFSNCYTFFFLLIIPSRDFFYYSITDHEIATLSQRADIALIRCHSRIRRLPVRSRQKRTKFIIVVHESTYRRYCTLHVFVQLYAHYLLGL